ncbi:hypothetical protein COCSUDRAFT_67348 [Coccomyxa subellipsoidea C-169]|uniref:RING-type domain-containing protein n=1 Tax=Coccomyxa subellipsoidea (strain C-169) TaxID=574566 RepID=I0YPT9_COCSC|nr:hypothetical protein COCSUDRAFT_67348 [Coccomyxa subellipsoidea C-169]EIE20408.1 hypothetical protein COCSUDRAFT_67348 [Coccomyxa subellipsoidea C-169]|eukprot:XP_005644952.1 hypothetical protein COCSUDRAFT_67348 [Coccomyxa subellipsoidea C-169]
MQDAEGNRSALGYVALHPDKKKPELWDAAAALSLAGVLKLKVIEVRGQQGASEQQQQPQLLEVACSGSLVLPAYATEPPPPGGRSPLAAAVHVIIQHIASLGQEPSDLSADTNVHGMEEPDVDSGEAEELADAPAEQMDLRDRIYEMLRPVEWTAEATEPSGLTCTMPGYQRRALAWMTRREALQDGGEPSISTAGGTSATAGGLGPSLPVWNGTHHPCWQRVALPSGEAFYHNWNTGQLQRMQPFAPVPLNGGALADEMGLGKTVIALALILKRPPPADWCAPLASAQSPQTPGTSATFTPGAAAPTAQIPLNHKGPRRNGATLIAATQALLGQAAGDGGSGGSPVAGKKRKRKMTMRQKVEAAQEVWEIQRQAFEAARNAAVPAAEKAAFEAQMERLITADIVLVAYPVHHARNALGEGRSLRRPKRYSVVDSPLAALHWWRLMLDEAQKVGDGFSQVGDMAALLRAESRWVVTGTPMGNGGLRDLHGLLRVLQHDPFADRRLWRTCVEGPCLRDEPHALERLEAVLKPIMWRNDKSSVGDELKLPPRTLERVAIVVAEGERSFYRSVQEAAVPAQEALQRHSAAAAPAGDGSDEAGPSSPRTVSRVEAARAERAARRAEEAAGSAVLDLRKCCDHPQLTSLWRRQAREGQLSQGTILTIPEQNARQADGLQNKLQGAERNLCVLLNTLAALLLEAPEAHTGPASPKHKGKGKQKAAADDKGTPQGPDRKRRKTELTDSAIGYGSSWEERRTEALALLRRSRLISEEGIGATWGEPATDIKSASAAIRAWRPIQVSVLEQLADLLEASGAPRTEDEDLASMRDEARRKLDDINEVPREACMEREVRLAELTGKLEEAGRKVARLWARAHAAGWQERRPTDAPAWCAALLSAYDSAKAAAAAASAEAGQVQWAAVTELLQPEEERLMQTRAALEGVCVTPVVATALSNAQAVLSALQGNLPLPRRGAGGEAASAALTEAMQDIPEQRIVRLAREGSSLNRALVAAHALRRLHPIDTLDYQKAVSSVKKVVNALRREHDKLLQRRSLHPTSGFMAQDNDLEAAIAALDAVCAQLDFVRGVRERHTAEVQLEVARHNLGVAEEEARVAAAVVSQNSSGKSMAALHANIAELEATCRQLLSRQRFLRGTAESEQPEHIHDAGPGMTDQQLPEPAAPPGSWPAGVRAKTGLSAALGPWQVSLAAPHLAGTTAPASAARLDLTAAPSGAAAGQGLAPAAYPAAAAPGPGSDIAAAAEAADEAMPDAGNDLGSLPGQEIFTTGLESSTLGRAAEKGKEVIVSPRSASMDELARLRAERHARWLEQQEREGSGDRGGPSSRGEAAGPPGSQGSAETPRGANEVLENTAGTSNEAALGAGGGVEGGASGSGAGREEGRAGGNAECLVCFSSIDSAMLLPCGHWLCEACYQKWYSARQKGRKQDCMVCRQPFNFSGVFRAPIAPQPRDAVVRDDPKYQKVVLKGQWGSKIEALLRRLLWLQAKHPEVKSLVFSQWQGALLMVSAALDLNQVKHGSLTGRHRGQGPREVIKKFQEDTDMRVLLLTRGAGGDGLTLTQASQVFLLEPSVSVPVEQQAIARVHRFGQKKPILITRFISQNTVEEEVVREAEATQSLLSDDGVHTASMLQKSEDMTTDLNIRLLTAALRQRPSSAADNADAPGRPDSA